MYSLLKFSAKFNQASNLDASVTKVQAHHLTVVQLDGIAEIMQKNLCSLALAVKNLPQYFALSAQKLLPTPANNFYTAHLKNALAHQGAVFSELKSLHCCKAAPSAQQAAHTAAADFFANVDVVSKLTTYFGYKDICSLMQINSLTNQTVKRLSGHVYFASLHFLKALKCELDALSSKKLLPQQMKKRAGHLLLEEIQQLSLQQVIEIFSNGEIFLNAHSHLLKVLTQYARTANSFPNARIAVQCAIDFSAVDVLQLLVLHGLDVNYTFYHRTAVQSSLLMWACGEGELSFAKFLLVRGANAHWQSEDGCQALHWAACRQHFQLVELLLEQDCAVNASNAAGQTPLMLACQKGETRIAKILLERGASVNLRDAEERQAIHFAARRGSFALVKLLLKQKAEINQVDIEGQTPFIYACQSKKEPLKIIDLLLDNQCLKHLATYSGSHALHFAADRGHIKTVKRLLQQGADVNLPNKFGCTPLLIACQALPENVLLVNLLIKQGADCHFANRKGSVALHWAAERAHKKVLQALVLAGANLNAVDCQGNSALQLACGSGPSANYQPNAKLVHFLLQWGADAQMVNAAGKCALENIVDYAKAGSIKKNVAVQKIIGLLQSWQSKEVAKTVLCQATLPQTGLLP